MTAERMVDAANVDPSGADALDGLGVLRYDMRRQYELGNLPLYAKYKQLLDFLGRQADAVWI